MREILFRGKDPKTGIWYTGQYIHLHKTTYCVKEDYDRHPDNDIHQIVFEQMTDWGLPNDHLRADVDPATVGQYTGLKDKNGVRIFEGDLIEYDNSVFEMKYIDGFATFDLRSVDNMSYAPCTTTNTVSRMKVIGNIHDRSEVA